MAKFNKKKNRNNNKNKNKDLATIQKVLGIAFSIVGGKIPHLQQKLPIDTYMFQEFTEAKDSIVSSASVTVSSYAFSFNLLNDSASLIAVFDEYKILSVEQWFLPVAANNSYSSAANLDPGLFTTYVDPTSATASSIATALEYATAVTTTGLDAHYHKFKPVPQVNGVMFPNEWISLVNGSTIAHFGSGAVWSAVSGFTVGFPTYNIITRYTVVLRKKS
jgi:hypothetical protein